MKEEHFFSSLPEQRALLTLFYAGQYLPGLSFKELERRMLGQVISSRELKKALQNLKKAGLVKEIRKEGKNSFQVKKIWCLADSRQGKQARDVIVDQKWLKTRKKEIDEVVEFLKRQQWCRGLALTGAQTFSQVAGDIDFLVVTEVGRLWQGRLKTLLWAFGRGKKRHPRQQADQGWCFNLWLSDSREGLQLPQKKQTLFSAYELLQMQWLWNRSSEVEGKMIEANQWLAGQLGNFWREQEEMAAGHKNGFLPDYATIVREKCKNNWPEEISWKLQKLYRQFRMRQGGQEIISREQAFFHPSERKNRSVKMLVDSYQSEYQNKYWWRQSRDKMPLSLARMLERARKNGQVVVMVTGVFDLLHEAHLDFLKRAAEAGEVLIVGVESDRRVRAIKGKERPVCGQLERYLALSREEVVDGVVVLPDDFGDQKARWKVMREISPDVLAVSSSSSHLIDKENIMQELGGKMLIVKEHDPSISTTQKMQK